MSADWETLLPLLVHIQANLDADLGLAALSRKAGISPSHLNRQFKTVVGETPKDHLARLRLERGAFRMLIHDANLMDIALDCGFRNHETFTRAFKRRFGKTPSDYRDWLQRQSMPQPHTTHMGAGAPGYALSSTKIIRLRTMHLAFIRHTGPYEAVPQALFDTLRDWALHKLMPGPMIWMGIGHDAPVATPSEQLRFDAALVVPGPFATEGEIAYQLLSAGDVAVTTHAGPLDTLPAAYAAIFPRVMALPGYQLIGLPSIEIYHANTIQVQHSLKHTDICLPMQRRAA
jgi:AraC family transcriptional regulator